MADPSLGAACAYHPAVAAAFTCPRCGSFACHDCRGVLDVTQCRPCEQRTGDAVGTSLSIGDLLSRSFSLTLSRARSVVAFAAFQGALYIPIAVFLLPWMTERFADASSRSALIPALILVALANMLVTTIAQGAFLHHFGALLRNEDASIGESLKIGLSRSVALILMNIVLALGLSIGFALCIVPGVILALGWSLAGAAVVIGRASPVEALGQSWGLTRGHRLTIFGAVFVIVLLLVAVAVVYGAITGGVAAVAPEAVRSLLNVAGQLAQALFLAPLYALTAVLYMRLERTQFAV